MVALLAFTNSLLKDHNRVEGQGLDYSVLLQKDQKNRSSLVNGNTNSLTAPYVVIRH